MNLKEYNIAISQKTYKSLEEALKAMMEAKRLNPHSCIHLYPADDDVDARWCDSGFGVNTDFFCTNLPYIVIGADEDTFFSSTEETIKKVSDEEAYVANVAAQIRNLGEVRGDEGWHLAVTGMDDSFDITLVVKPESWAEVSAMVEDFNRKYEALSFIPFWFDEANHAVEGRFVPKTVKKKLFGSSKGKKENETQRAATIAFVESLSPYLRNV